MGLGTDGPMSGNNLDLFRQMAVAAPLQKNLKGDRTLIDSKQILSLQIQDEGVSLFKTEIVDIIDFDVPLISNNFDSWEVLDWRDVN